MFGNGSVKFEWSMDYEYIASFGYNQMVVVFDKRGVKLKELVLNNQNKSQISKIEWDKDNEYLAIMYEKQNYVTLWNVFEAGSVI